MSPGCCGWGWRDGIRFRCLHRPRLGWWRWLGGSVLQASYKGIALAGAVPQGFLLDALAALLESIDSEMDDVEGIHDQDRLW